MSNVQRQEQQKNIKAFQKMLPKLKALRGKYFLVRRGKIVNYYDSFNDAYSTGAAVYDDKKFSVCLLKGPKARTKKESATKGPVTVDPESVASLVAAGTPGVASLAVAGTPGVASLVAAAHWPKKTDVPGYDSNFPDQSPTHFEEAAKALRIKPFYKGPDARRFDCLMAELVPTTIYSGNPSKARSGLFNGYRLTSPWCS
jgi:hypothetical protein